MKSLVYLFLLSLISIVFVNTLQSQITLNDVGSKNVYEIQKGLGANANYFDIKSYMDSLIRNGIVNDTAEDGMMSKYMRWDWFWKGRVASSSNLSNRGDFSSYMKLMTEYSKSNSCPPNPTNIQYNWKIDGPFQLPTQNMGRVDVIRTIPYAPSSKIAYAGTPNSGLWKTNDYTISNPEWVCITDGVNLPNFGIKDMVIDPNNTSVAYISAGYSSWTNFGLGVLKTVNLNSPQPTWDYILEGPSNGFAFRMGRILLDPSNSQNFYAQRDNEIYYSTDGGTTFNQLVNINTIAGGNPLAILSDFIIDKNFNNIIYLSGYVYNTNNINDVESFLWRFDINNSTTVTQVILQDYATSYIKLNNGPAGTYALYNINNVCSDWNIERTNNGGNTWNLHNQFSSGIGIKTSLPIFEVNDINDQIIYLEGGDGGCGGVLNRRLLKSINAGTTFQTQYGYIQQGSIHPDIRGIYMINPSLDGSADEFFIGNDGGVSYSNSTIASIPTNLAIFENKNGNGLSITQYYGMGQTKKGEDVYAAGAQDNGTYKNINNTWSVQVDGDGYEAYFMEESPQISFRQNGLGYRSKYKRFSNYLNNSVPFLLSDYGLTSSINTASNPNNPNYCKAYYFNQAIKEVKGDLYVSYLNLHKSTDDGATWTQVSDFDVNHGIPTNFIMEGFAVSHQDPNKMYAGFGKPTWNLDQSYLQSGCVQVDLSLYGSGHPIEKRLYKTTTGSSGWIDITPNMDGPFNTAVRWSGITDMVISPTNDDKLWVTFDGIGDLNNFECGGDNRVKMTIDGGNTWVDYSDNLPYLPINKIVYYNGTNDGLFVANDLGVYYTDADLYPNEGWIRVSNDLPSCFVSDIDINYCRGIIRIATYGRGIWEADLQLPYVNTEEQITSNTTWNYDRNIISDVLITAGNTLTINDGAIMNIAKGKKIMIEKGAKLIINNATLTNKCGQLWQGIEVWGDRYASQLTQGAQGYLEIKNGAVIENARFAVRTSQFDSNGNTVWDTFGGIVKVSNSTFRNNRSGIDFAPYQNFVPGNPSATLKDLSFVINTTFTWEDNSNLVALGVQPYSHIGMWLNHGIVFSGNDFRNDASYTTYGGMNRGIGMVTFDAEYRVVSKCNSLTIPCSSYDDNNFVNLTYGIKASASNSFNTLVVKDANFVNCQRGILLKDIDYASLTKNNFDVASPVSPISNNYTYGIYLDNCNGYEVEENFTTSTVLTPPNSIPTYGIYAFNSGQVANEIYKNTCENTAIGIQSSNVNGNGDQFNPQGLEFKCNELNNLSNSSLAITDILARPFQGSCGTASSPANNSFDYSSGYDVWTNPFLPFIGYRYSIDPGGYGLEPRNPPNTNNNLFKNQCFFPYDDNTACPSHQPLPVAVLLANYSTFKAAATTTGSVIDGGNADNLLSIISNSPDYQVRNELINASPYLSNKVILSMLDRVPALPDWVIQQVLEANAPLNDEIFVAMLERTPALPDYLVRNLAMASSPLSTKEQLILLNRVPFLPDWVISQVMIENSPLFDDVLYALMDRVPFITNSSIRNIFTKNTPLSEEVKFALENHFPSYPNWVINAINNSPYVAGEPLEEPQPSSPLMEISQEAAEFNNEATLTKNALFRTYLHDTTGTYGIADVIAFIKNEEGCTKNHCDLTKAYIKQGDLINAQTKIDSLVQDTSLAVFIEFNNTLIDLKQSNTTLNTNPTAKQSTENIALSTTVTKEKSAAEAMLAFEQFMTYQEVFEEIVPVAISSRIAPANTIQLMDDSYKLDVVSVYPNPAHTDFTVSYNLNSDEDAIFTLYDITGKQVMNFKIDQVLGEKKLSTKLLNSGVYFYSVTTGNSTIMQDKLVITKD